jgi:pimeloyl-ACP methyl ester carboxylesterase
MEVLRRAPDRVSRVALMDTNPLAETPEMAAAREPQMARVKAGKLEEVMGEEMKPAYLAPGPGRPGVLRTMMEMALSLGPDVFLRQSRALQRRRDQQATLARTRVPALILCGEHDSLCPIQRHEVMAELMPAAGLVVIENAGHLPTLENPDETGDALADWLHR